MANTIKIKHSAVSGKVPTTTDIELGELAINTHDGKLFLKKDDSTEAIVEIGAGGGGSGSILESQQTISADYTLSSSYNGLSAGPVEVAAGFSVTVPVGATWAIV